MNNKGQSAGIAWIMGLVLLFAVGIIYVVTNQVLVNHVQPLSDTLIDNSPHINATQKTDIKDNNTKYVAFWGFVPIFFVLLIAISIIVSTITTSKREY